MIQIIETYNTYIFPVVAIICCGLLWNFKKKMMVKFPGLNFIDVVKTRRNELNQSLLAKYMATGIIFAVFCLILVVFRFI